MSEPSQPLSFAAAVCAALDRVPAGGEGESTTRRVWRALGDAGLIAALYPSDARPGGMGVRPRVELMGTLLQELDKRYPTGVVLAVCVQVAAAVPVLSASGGAAKAGGIAIGDDGTPAGSGAVQTAYQQVLAGEAMIALAATDAAVAGVDLMHLGTRIDIGSDGLLVTGGKRWITNACSADWLLVLGRHRPQPHFTSLVWALVPAGAAGVDREPAGDTMFRGAAVGHLSFNHVALTREHLVGAPGRGLAIFGRHVTTERLASALWSSARARRTLVETRHYLAGRVLNGSPLWESPAARIAYARCLLEWWRMDQLTRVQAAALSEPDALTSSMLLKASVAEGLQAVLTGCARLRGADGFVAGGLVELSAESMMFGVAGGATDAMLAGAADQADALLARHAFGSDIAGEGSSLGGGPEPDGGPGPDRDAGSDGLSGGHGTDRGGTSSMDGALTSRGASR